MATNSALNEYMQNEEELLKRFNERRFLFKAWPIAPIPGLTTSFTKSWLVLVKLPKQSDDLLFPSTTDRFSGKYSLTNLPCTRIQNPYEDIKEISCPLVARCAAFKVDVPRSWQNDDGLNTASNDKSEQDILAALRRFVEDKRLEESELSLKARSTFYNLHNEFPHLKDPAHPKNRTPKLLLEKFQAFNADHRAAYEALTEIPNGLFLLNGCPGSGKTEWNMRPGSKRKHSPILFVVDLNKTAAGLKLRIVRMHGSKLNGTTSKTKDTSPQDDLDFTRKFLTSRNPDKAPTLDEAAWEYFDKHKDDCFTPSQVSLLYRAVLAQTDFVATTPLFRPDIVFVDEAPHARELTTLIPIAFFEPIAWILTGDVKQTCPFVKGGDKRDSEKLGLKFNPHASQLKLSLMARADLVGAIKSKLLVNKRSHGNLQRLPSNMFYEGRMISGYSEAERYPTSALHLKRYLQEMGGVSELSENRAVIRLKDSREEMQLNSFWNPVHHRWIIQEVRKLLHSSGFLSLDGDSKPGTIMIETPYSTSERLYLAEVRQWPAEFQDRVKVMTVDKAQGNQADVVFLDMVRTTKAGFMNEPQRLNVAITRSRQAEIILMHYQMTWRTCRGKAVRAENTAQIWDDAVTDNRVFEL
ncbi:P-loop containing nucleoside triphosphate hydrolase protein [Mariannaea sp. PMI_226]|nr:P-loop containing nucleoside triphosphate hydrolase protein [Mariannaea sp. PMI_226]